MGDSNPTGGNFCSTYILLSSLKTKRAPTEEPQPLPLASSSPGEPLWSFDFPQWEGMAAGDREGHVCLPEP